MKRKVVKRNNRARRLVPLMKIKPPGADGMVSCRRLASVCGVECLVVVRWAVRHGLHAGEGPGRLPWFNVMDVLRWGNARPELADEIGAAGMRRLGLYINRWVGEMDKALQAGGAG